MASQLGLALLELEYLEGCCRCVDRGKHRTVHTVKEISLTN